MKKVRDLQKMLNKKHCGIDEYVSMYLDNGITDKAFYDFDGDSEKVLDLDIDFDLGNDIRTDIWSCLDTELSAILFDLDNINENE